MNLRLGVIDMGFRAFAATRLHRLAAPLTQGLGAVLTFHRVADPPEDAFDPQAGLRIAPAFLDIVLDCLEREGLDVVTMDEALRRLAAAARGERPRRFAVLSFDDGYRDTFIAALPILRRRRAPFIVHVTTGFADRSARLWWVELEESIRRLDSVSWRSGGATLALPAKDAAQKSAAFVRIYRELRRMDEPRLLESVARLAGEAGLEPAKIAADLCMDWDELRRVGADPLCAIGAHTLTHPRLAVLEEDQARAELVASREILGARLGRRPDHVCYPVGDAGSAAAREFRLAREAGYASGVTTRPGVLFAGHADAPHALPRISINGAWQSRGAVETLLSGAPFALWNGFRRLDVA